MTDLTPKKIVAGFVVVVLLCIIGMYCSSSSETDTGKADKLGNAANTAHQESITVEENIKPLAQEERAIEERRIQATKTYQKARLSKNFLAKKRADYEKVRNTPANNSTDDLSARERKLLAKLKGQYPTF